MAETTDNHRLIVSLEARLRSYEREIQRATRVTDQRMGAIEKALRGPQREFTRLERAAAATSDRVSRSMATLGVGARGLATGIVAGGALAALTSLTGAFVKARRALSDFDAINDVSRTVGLATDAYQALGFAALQVGVDQEKLNAGLGIFAKNVGLAQVGTGALSSSLKTLNPELLKSILNASNQEDRLRLVADAMHATSDATQRAALATAVFGKGGLELVRILDGGAAALDEFKRRGKELGLIVPDDLLKRAGELDDKLDVLAKVIDVNLNTALVKLAPLLVSTTEGVASIAQEVNRMSEAVDNFHRNPDLDGFLAIFNMRLIEGGLADQFRDFLNGGLAEVRRSSGEIKAEIDSIEAKISDLQALGSGDIFALSNIDRERESLAELRAELKRVESSTEAAAANGGNALGKLADSASAALDDVSKATAAQAEEAANFQSVLDQVNAAASNLGGNTVFAKQTQALSDYVEKSQRAAAATDTIATAQEQLAVIARGALKEIAGAVDVNFAAYERAQAELDGIAGALSTNSTNADALVKRLQGLEISLRELGVGEDVISRLVVAFGTLAGSIFNAKAALDAYNKTKVGTTGVRQNYDVGGGSNVGVTRFDNSAADAEPTAPTLKTINVKDFLAGARAGGGDVLKDESYVVGENGPEIFTPSQNGTIIPNDAINHAATPTPSGFAGFGASSDSSPSNMTSLLGRSNFLKDIEDNTWQALEELRNAVGYLATIQNDGEATLGAVRALQDAIGDLRATQASGTTSIVTDGGYPGGSNGSADGSKTYNSNDARAPYYYNPGQGRPGGASYDPVADFMYNGNQGALGLIANSPYSMYEATPWNNPFDVNRNRFQTNADIAAALGGSGPSIGTPGGALDLGGSDIASSQGTGFFGDGPRLATGSTDAQLAAKQAEEDRQISTKYWGGFSKGGIIPAGDNERILFDKNHRETVGIFTPRQMDAMKQESSYAGGNTYNAGGVTIVLPPGYEAGPRSLMAIRDAARRGTRDSLGNLG